MVAAKATREATVVATPDAGGTAMRERTEDVSRVRVICGALSQRLSVDTHMAEGEATHSAAVARQVASEETVGTHASRIATFR